MTNINKKILLLGTWIRDPEDVESIRRFGNVKLHFTADGQLIYTILGKNKDQKIFLTYKIENNVLITDQPSDPREERTNFRITEDGKLEQECSDGKAVSYVRDHLSKNIFKIPIKIHKTFVRHNMYNFAQFIGFYTAHVVWSLEGLNGENVSPLLAVQKAEETWIERFEGDASYECAVVKARETYDTMPLYDVFKIFLKIKFTIYVKYL